MKNTYVPCTQYDKKNHDLFVNEISILVIFVVGSLVGIICISSSRSSCGSGVGSKSSGRSSSSRLVAGACGVIVCETIVFVV